MGGSPQSASPFARSRLLWWSLALLFAIAIGARFARPLWWRSAFDAAGRREAPVSGTAGPAGTAWSADPAGAPLAPVAPPFSFTERSGRTVSRDDLEGRVWIADFIFTRCPSVCPALTRKMSEVRALLKENGADDVLSVSFSVDPVFDTPQVLSAYASQFGASPSSWLFLTGDPSEMLRVVNQGFRLIMVDPAEGPPAHSNRFVLVDAKGRIRGMHDGSEPGVALSIAREAQALLQETGAR